MECEICGRKQAVCLIYVEGAKMNACNFCSKTGECIERFSTSTPAPPSYSQKTAEPDIIEDYGKKIKDARVRLGLSLKELGLKIAERESYLEHVEKEHLLPTIKLIRKLEKFLNIKLMDKRQESLSSESISTPKNKELTLLDAAEIEDNDKIK